jgi:hypothetical protein
MTSLTTVFGMGTGVTSSLWPPKPLSNNPNISLDRRIEIGVIFNNSISEHEQKENIKPSAD